MSKEKIKEILRKAFSTEFLLKLLIISAIFFLLRGEFHLRVSHDTWWRAIDLNVRIKD